jgi:pantoate kinase
MSSSRRGTTLILVLCLWIGLGATLSGALAVAGATSAASEREYRRSQALALAEAAVEEARAGLGDHPWSALGSGEYALTSSSAPGVAHRVIARGRVISASGVVVSRTVYAALDQQGRVLTWKEGP